MEPRDSGRVQDKLIKQLERQEKKQAIQQERFFRLKLSEIHNKLSQTLLMKKVIETDNPSAVSTLILKGLKQALNSSEFDFEYFIAPVRKIVPRPDRYALYMTQYIIEGLINDPSVIDIYGTDLEIYEAVNEVFSQVSMKFEKVEEGIAAQLSHDKSLVPGTREYEIAMDRLFREKVGEPVR